MSKKLIIPNREASYTDEQYTNIVKQSIKEQRPYLDDEELSSLATFKMGSVEPPKSVSKPIEAEKPKTFTQLAKSIKAEKPQPFKSTTEMVDKFVPKQAEPKLELADPNKAAATARMLDKFIPTQPKEAPMELVGKDFAPEPQKQASTLNKIAPNVQQVTESNAIPNPQIQSQENQSQAEDIRQQLLAKKNNVGKPFFGEEELPLNEALQPKENGSILNVEPKRDNVQISTKDKFDEDAENALPQGSVNEKIVYAETLRQNDGKIDMFNAKNIAKILPDEDFRKLIDFKSLTNTYKKEGIGDLALAAAKQAIGSEEDKSVEDYLYSQDFKERVIKESKGVPQNMGAAAEYIIANKKAEFKDAPSAYQRKMQEFSDWAAANNKPLYVLNKANTGMWQGVANVGQLIGGVVSGTIKTAKQLSNNESADYMSNVYEGVDKAGKHLSRVVPIADSQKGDAATRGIGDVVQMVTEIGSSMGVVKSVSPFTKIKNFLSLGKNSEAFAAKGLGLEAQLAVKAQSNANKGLIEIAKILQSKPSNTVAKILDNTVNNYVAMGAPTMIGQRQKYIDMGFTEEQAERRASGMTFLNMLALSLPNVLRPHEMSIMEKVFNKGNFKEGALSSVKQGRNFFVDMTAIRLAEEQVDESAKRDMGIPIERKSFGEKLTEITEHGLKDLTAGIIMGGLGRMKYKQSDMQLAGVAEAFNNPEALNESIKNSVKSGKVSKEDAVAFQTFLNTLKPEYDKAVTEVRKDGTPKFAPAIAAKVAIERTKQKQAEQTLQSLENSVEKWKTSETDKKTGEVIEKILYRHSDGKMYDYEEAKTLRQRSALVGAVMDARKTVAQLESGQYVKGKLVSANQMKAITEMNSLNGEAKKGQIEAIEANAPFENVEFEVVDFAKQPEIAKRVEEIKNSGEMPPEMPSANDPILNEKGEVIEGRTQVAHAIVRGGGKITFMKPLSTEKAKEATNIALGDKLGETQPITEGLGETDIIAINEAQGVYAKHLEANEGDFDGAMKAAARDLTERQYTADETKDMLKRMNGGDALSEPLIDYVYREASKAENVPQETLEGGGVDVELKNEGKADAPTKESVTERLNMNNSFYKKVEDALVKLGLIEKYNPETGTGDVVGGYAQQTSDGGFSVGKMLFSKDGSISYFDGDVKVSFDKNGNVISENTKEAKQKADVLAIQSKKEIIYNLEKTRDSEAFKYKEITETDVLGNKKKVKRLKTEQELKESTDKINAAIDKAKAELSNLEQPLKETESSVGVGGDVELEKPSAEQQFKDVQEGNMVTFEYKNESEVPEVFKDKISSKGEINGKPYVKVSMAKSLADFHLKEQLTQKGNTSNVGVEEGSVGVGGDVEATAKSITEKLSKQQDDLIQSIYDKYEGEEASKKIKELFASKEYKDIEEQINQLNPVGADLDGFEKTLSESDAKDYAKYRGIGYRLVAADKENGYKPFKVTESEKKQYAELRKRFDSMFADYSKNVDAENTKTKSKAVEKSLKETTKAGSVGVGGDVKSNWNYEGEGDAFASNKDSRDGKSAYVIRVLDKNGRGNSYNRAKQRGELDTESPLTYEGDKESVSAVDGNGNTVGVIKLQTDGGVEHIVVAPEFSRKGVASELIKQIEQKGAKVQPEKSKQISPDAAKLFNKLQSLKETPKAETPKVESKEGFTEGKDLNKMFTDLKSKYGDKKGSALYEVANRLVNPNKNTIVEIRGNGVVVKEGENYILKPFGNTDANSKKWTLYKGIDVTDQFAKSETPKAGSVGVGGDENAWGSDKGLTENFYTTDVDGYAIKKPITNPSSVTIDGVDFHIAKVDGDWKVIEKKSGLEISTGKISNTKNAAIEDATIRLAQNGGAKNLPTLIDRAIQGFKDRNTKAVEQSLKETPKNETDGTTELERTTRTSESKSEQGEGGASIAEQSDVRAVEANKEGQEDETPIAIAKAKGVSDMSIAERMRQRAAKDKGIEEPNEEDVVETPQDLSNKQAKHNRLAAIKKSYNALTKSKKTSEQGKTLMKQINGLATELQYVVGIKNVGDGSIKVLNSKGSDIKAIGVKSELPKPSDIAIERAKFLIDKGVAFYSGDVMSERTEFSSLTRAEIEKGVLDIEKGKMSVPAIKLISELNEMYESKTIPTIIGGGGSFTNRGSMELDKMVDSGFPIQLELTEKDIQYIKENEATLAQEYDAWYEGLSDIEKLEHLNIITDAKETENRKAEINASRESEANVSNEKDAKESELTQKENQLVKEEAKLSKLQQSLEVVGKENQFDIFGGKPSDSMLFETSVSDAEKVYKAQKKIVDGLKSEISDIKDEIQTAKDSEVTANQIAMELPTSKLKEVSSFIRDAAAKLREQHQKDLDDPNTIQRQGGLSKKQVAIALEKIADIIDVVGDVEKAIKQFLDGIKEPKERKEYEKEINNFFLEEYGEKEVVSESSPKSEPKEEKTAKEFIEEHKGEMVERTLLSQRLKPSNIVDSVKQFFSDYENSMREIDSHEKADLNAARLIQDVGMDEAVRMAKDGEIQGAFQSAVLGAKWLEADNNIKAATTPEEIAKAEKEYSEILKLVGKTQEKMGGANSYWGTFYSRNENLGLTTADKIALWEVKSGGNVASEKIREAYEKLDAENKENLAEIKRLREEAEKFQMQEIIDEIKDRAKRKPKTKTEEDRRQRVSDKLMALAEKVRESETSGLTLSTPIPPHIVSDSIKLLAKGFKAGEYIGDTMAKIYKLIEGGINKKLTDEEKKKVYDHFKRRHDEIVNADLEENIVEIDTNEPLTTAVLKELVEKGFDTPEKLFEKVKEFFPKGTSDRKIRDSITKYGQEITQTQTEIGQKVSAIKSIWAKISQLEDVAKGKLPFRRNPPENKEFRDERRRKMNELREAMKNLDVPEAEMEDKWKTRIETAKTHYKNAIADYEKAIEDGEVIVKNKAEKLNDKDIEELKRELELIKDAYNDFFGEEPMSEGERKIQALEKQLEAIGKERSQTDKVEIEYTASEINDIEILKNQIAARKKAVKMEGTTLKTEAEKNIEKLQKRLDDIRFGAEKRTSEKRELSQEEKDLVEQIKDEKAKQGTQKAKRTSEQIKIDAIDAAIDRVESLIRNNDLEIKRNPKGETSLSLKAKREAYEATKKGLLEARKEAGIIEKEQLRKRAEYLKKRIEYYEERKKKGDYSKKERKKSPINDEINRLLGKNDVLKFEEQKLMHLAEEQAKSWHQKRMDNIADIWNIPRIQMATGEFSFMGVQGRRLGASYFLKNPKALKEAVQTMLKSFASEEKLAEAMSKIKNDDPTLYHAMKVVKLDITEASYKLKAAEENTQRIGGAFLWKLVMDLSFIPLSKGVSKVSGNKTFEGLMKTLKDKPFYENFERAAVGYNNFLRVKAFADFTEGMRIDGKNIENSEKEFKIYANYLNAATGRGSLGVLEPIAELLAKGFFSPRNFSSEFQLATTPFGVGKLVAMQLKSDTKLKNFTQEQSAVKEALKHQVRYTVLQSVVAIGATWLLYKNLGSTDENEDGTGVELDLRSTKFGTATFKDGKTVDFFSGGLRYLILASRIRTQEYKTADRVKIFNDKAYVKKGEVKELGEGYIPDALGLITQIAANKVNPSLGAAYTLWTAEPKTNLDKELGIKRDRFGRRVSASSVAKELTAPIFWKGVVESVQNDPTIVDGLGQLAAFFAFAGYRVQNKEKLAREEQEQVKKDRIEAKQKRIEEKQKRPKYRF